MKLNHNGREWTFPDAGAELWEAEHIGTSLSASAIDNAVKTVLARNLQNLSAAVDGRESALRAKGEAEKKLKEVERARGAAHAEFFGPTLDVRLAELETAKAQLQDAIGDATAYAADCRSSLRELRELMHAEIVTALRELKKARRTSAEDAVRLAKEELHAAVKLHLAKLVKAEGTLAELRNTKPELHAETALATEWPTVFGEGGIAPESEEEPELETMAWVRNV